MRPPETETVRFLVESPARERVKLPADASQFAPEGPANDRVVLTVKPADMFTGPDPVRLLTEPVSVPCRTPTPEAPMRLSALLRSPLGDSEAWKATPDGATSSGAARNAAVDVSMVTVDVLVVNPRVAPE